MKRARSQRATSLVLAGVATLVLVALLACEGVHHAKVQDTMARVGGVDAARIADSAFDFVALTRLYAGLKTVAYHGPGLGARMAGLDTVKVETLWIEDRRPHIARFPCSQCHADQGPATGPRDAHFGLALNHAAAEVMQCATCHGEAMRHDSLVSLGGKSIAFETSFQLCAQCHMTQARDFMGGAHGKRLAGWTGPRVVRNCTGCHDPHAPQIEKRWPATAATRGDAK